MQHQDLLALVLCLCVPRYSSGHAEWVEISQHGYRKGFTPHPTTPNTFLARPTYFPHAIKTHSTLHGTAHDHDNVTDPFLTRKRPIIQRINIGSIEKVDLEPEEILRQKKKPLAASVSNANSIESQKISTEYDNGNRTDVSVNKEKFKTVEDDKPIVELDNGETLKNKSTPLVPESTIIKNMAKFNNVSMDEQNTGNEVHSAKNEHLNNLSAVIKVLKLVQETISKSSHKTVKSKMRYLEDLKNSIMFSIEDRLEALWPAETGAARSRSSRSSKGDQVDFPSAESALMSISFLTFAVFLIKLVMQVIQTYKSKAMMVTPVFTTMGRAVFTHNHNN